MRKCYVPLALLGISGLGLLILTNAGRRGLRWALEHAHKAPDALLDFNQRAQAELERIQVALNRVAETLETAR